MQQMGTIRFNEGDIDKAIEYLTKAAELGDAAAHYNLGNMYWKGGDVEIEEEKGIYHMKRLPLVVIHKRDIILHIMRMKMETLKDP